MGNWAHKSKITLLRWNKNYLIIEIESRQTKQAAKNWIKIF